MSRFAWIVLGLALARPAAAAPHEDRWTEIAPPGRADHAAVYDPAHRRLFIFGGQVDGAFRNDVWMLSLSGGPRWTLVDTKGETPAPRTGAAAAYDAAHDRLLVFGGRDTSYNELGDFWELSLHGRPRWRRIPMDESGPSARYRATLTPIPGSALLLYGGQRTYDWKLGDAWTLSLETLRWTPIHFQSSEPAPRDAHTAAYCPDLGGVVVFGGEIVTMVPDCYLCYANQETDDLWLLKFGDPPEWHRLESPSPDRPCPTQGHISAWDGPGHRILLFGGGRYYQTCANKDPDLWSLSTTSLVWSRLDVGGPCPRPRSFIASAFDPVARRLYIHGGEAGVAGGRCYSDTWGLSMSREPAWDLMVPSQVPPIHETLVMDSEHDRMVTALGTRVWSYDLRSSTWSYREIAGDTLPSHGGMAVLDSKRDRVIAYGGWTGGYPGPSLDFPEVWSLNLEGEPRWTRLRTEGDAPGTLRPVGIYDPILDRMIVVATGFGGSRGGVFGLPIDESRPHIWTSLSRDGELDGPPRGLISPAVTLDSRRNRLLLFGGGLLGIDGVVGINGCWALPLGSPGGWERVSPAEFTDPSNPTLPNGRSMASAAYEPTQDRMIVAGGVVYGLGGGGLLDDAWALRLDTVSWQRLRMETDPHPHWSNAQVFYDRARDRSLVLQGDLVWAIESAASRRATLNDQESAIAAEGRIQGLDLVVQPNPLSRGAIVRMTLPDASEATIEVLDIAGRRIWVQDVGSTGPGVHTLEIAQHVPRAPGVYLVRLIQGASTRTSKVVRLEE